MQMRNDRSICNAQLHDERHFQLCFGNICNAVNRMRKKWLSHAASLASQHYTAEGKNLSCTAPKITWRLVLLDSQLDYGVGTFLLRIDGNGDLRVRREGR